MTNDSIEILLIFERISFLSSYYDTVSTLSFKRIIRFARCGPSFDVSSKLLVELCMTLSLLVGEIMYSSSDPDLTKYLFLTIFS